MDKYQIIGEGKRNSWPYQVAVHWAVEHPGGPIMLAEGSGHSGAGGNFALAAILGDTWTEHLEICDCLWLRDLAREEQERGALFAADEIWERAKHQQNGAEKL